ncbi:MAG: hypothetical protein ACUBOA_05600 [Candidatus Loosdrechtia sp.]|uniref:hypothetical protein n=1 Tax=Candidatus Loosdrechtia sp. TaxID=3101272 RepID=UPI003A76E6B7|nr:MAG: hypothetical protein QY305_06570 [Candidatus Jettenia sp. AMX2]
MNLDLYYLIPSLPEIKEDKKPIIGSYGFLDLCRPYLSTREFIYLEKSRLYTFDWHNPFEPVREWYRMESDFRNQMVELRAEKTGKQPLKFFRGEYLRGKIDEDVRILLQIQEPDEMAEALFKRRWHLLNRLHSGQFFTLEWLGIYYLKLQLVEERFKYSKEAGEKNLHIFLIKDSEYHG